ncbi:MAG: MarR family transcriptional regulator [Actinomycetota bacterium]|nr:MarR family transcriptional regulator [Actinomycetota bacterium]
MAQWSFLTNHARVLLCIAHDPGLRLRDMAEALGITERSAFAIVADLTEAGYVLKERDGRRNRYSIQHHMPLPDSTGRERTVGEVLNLLVASKPRPRTIKADGRPRQDSSAHRKASLGRRG